MNSENLNRSFLDLGYAKIDTRDWHTSVKSLSKRLLADVVAMNITCLPEPKNAENLGDYIQELYALEIEKDLQLTSRIYQLLPTLPSLWSFAVGDELRALLAQNFKLNALSMGTLPLVRIDRPGNQHFSTPWHQDYWFSQSSHDSIVVWFPLCQLSSDMGYLRALPHPESYGIVGFKEYSGGHEPFEPIDPVDENKAVELDCAYGEVLVFKQSLLHKSGQNLSDKCRISCQLRFNNMRNQDIPFATFKSVHSDFVHERQKRYLNEKN